MMGEMEIFAGYARTYAETELLRGLQGGSGARDMAVGVVDHGRAGRLDVVAALPGILAGAVKSG